MTANGDEEFVEFEKQREQSLFRKQREQCRFRTSKIHEHTRTSSGGRFYDHCAIRNKVCTKENCIYIRTGGE